MAGDFNPSRLTGLELGYIIIHLHPMNSSSASAEIPNSITSVLVAAVTTANTLVIELWFSILALVLLQVHNTFTCTVASSQHLHLYCCKSLSFYMQFLYKFL